MTSQPEAIAYSSRIRSPEAPPPLQIRIWLKLGVHNLSPSVSAPRPACWSILPLTR